MKVFERLVICLFLIICAKALVAQQASITGTVQSIDGPLPFVTVVLTPGLATTTDSSGQFKFEDLKTGKYRLEFSYVGMLSQSISLEIETPAQDIIQDVTLEPDLNSFDEVVITGTKTWKRKTETAVIVNVVDSRTLDEVQACNLSEGLRFQPGLRVETDCQTCNYTQLRINGLAGGYSQILVNGRPIFSPLTGLYGLEQLPVNMIDRIEVIRGGGSSLYGSSAIGGTVNVQTRIPDRNSVSLNSWYQSINGNASDWNLNFNTALVNNQSNAGVSLFYSFRDREMYDHNDDNFSELPEIRNHSAGLTAFWLPTEDQKLEFSLARLSEYRYGGEMVEKAPHLAQQAEERDQAVWMSSLDYQINFNQGKSSLLSYLAAQRTDRDHYTGIIPDEDDQDALLAHLAMPPYGTSLSQTFNVGVQLNHDLSSLGDKSHVLTLGTEYVSDETVDDIPSYNYLIDQLTRNWGVFAQSDWELTSKLNLLSGARLDWHNLVDGIVFSPRVSLLYKPTSRPQRGMGYGPGFRAPQAFVTAWHIAFAGGGISRVVLVDQLQQETPDS